MRDVLTTALYGLTIATVLLALLFHAVVQQSYRNAPPTEQELLEDPSLVRYLDNE